MVNPLDTKPGRAPANLAVAAGPSELRFGPRAALPLFRYAAAYPGIPRPEGGALTVDAKARGCRHGDCCYASPLNLRKASVEPAAMETL
ncbi:hypothetical protein TREES_T100017800 [Tupaia chinensis]|uniref:Uncharacterized protein n=1 Tax=Tupaia chinensis TaxID=246437 RepID=L9KL39_TUPCH|nr:hypothetical protein TREES_T100017800 [Tupaia chinensis]